MTNSKFRALACFAPPACIALTAHEGGVTAVGVDSDLVATYTAACKVAAKATTHTIDQRDFARALAAALVRTLGRQSVTLRVDGVAVCL